MPLIVLLLTMLGLVFGDVIGPMPQCRIDLFLLGLSMGNEHRRQFIESRCPVGFDISHLSKQSLEAAMVGKDQIYQGSDLLRLGASKFSGRVPSRSTRSASRRNGVLQGQVTLMVPLPTSTGGGLLPSLGGCFIIGPE